MLRTNLGLIVGGCAMAAVGVVGGWTTLALRAPATQQPPEAISVQAPVVREPTPAAADETPDRRIKPAPAIAPTPSTQEPESRPRSAVASGPTGIWIDHTGRGAVEITECGANLCGRIVWLKDKGHKSVCGTQVIGNAKPVGKGMWDGGWIFDPEQNAKYSVELKPIGTDKLRVMGYMGSKLFSETMIWKRPNGDIERCDAPATIATPSSTKEDPKPAPTEVTRVEPTPEPAEPPAKSKGPKSANPSMADIEKVARKLLNGKSGGKQCTTKLPYVGNVSIPC